MYSVKCATLVKGTVSVELTTHHMNKFLRNYAIQLKMTLFVTNIF